VKRGVGRRHLGKVRGLGLRKQVRVNGGTGLASSLGHGRPGASVDSLHVCRHFQHAACWVQTDQCRRSAIGDETWRHADRQGCLTGGQAASADHSSTARADACGFDD